jgi:hypothetical protein
MPKLRRIPGRYHATLTGTTLTVALTAVVSCALTLKNVGLAPDTLMRFAASWGIASAIAVPARFALLPVVTRLIGCVTEAPMASASRPAAGRGQ